MKKPFLIISFIFILLSSFFLSVSSNFLGSRDFIKNNLSQAYKDNIKRIILGNEELDSINYYRGLAYNQKKLPETQFEKLNLKIIKLNYPGKKMKTVFNQQMGKNTTISRFYIEPLENEILIIYANGNFTYLDGKVEKKIRSNFSSKLAGIKILGSLKYKQNLFISYDANEKKITDPSNKERNYLKVAKASLEKKDLVFEEIYRTKDCKVDSVISAGKMVIFKNSSILLSTDAQFKFKNLAQDPESSFGKIIQINLEDYKHQIFSSGHRNPMGLFVEDDLILETEHGPCGGDEINIIEKSKNYGWPKMSMGDDYVFCRNFNNRKEYSYSKKNIDTSKFTDPVYSFVPSIGIANIIKIPNSFSKYWQDNYFVASLNGNSLYRVKFDFQFKKILFIEKIFIGDRIIDIKFDKKNNYFLLALEGGSSRLIKLSVI